MKWIKKAVIVFFLGLALGATIKFAPTKFCFHDYTLQMSRCVGY